jgi:conjugal transfer mating pair stabilization protein TraN
VLGFEGAYTMKALVALLLFMWAAAASAGDCQLSGSVCVDTSPSKNISGVTVTLAEVGGCWEYEDTYTCIKPNAVNYCQPFVNAQPACWQTSSQCSQMDTLLNSGCMKYLQTWRCGDPATPTPANTIRLNDTYTLISSNYDPGPCQSLDTNTNCQIAESQCVSTTPPSLPPGIDPAQVAPDGCYQKQNTYACLTGRADSSECDGYAANPNCSLQSTTTCDPEDQINGKCTFEQRTYQCMSQPPKTNTVTDCSGQLFCQNGNCFDKGYQNDTDFARSMALMEAAREAGTYMDPNSMEMFKGFDSRCKIKLFGLANCCKKSGGGGGYSNGALMGVVLSAGGQALKYGSYYVYDALMGGDGMATWYLAKGIDALSGAAEAAAKTGKAVEGFSPSISLYGLTFSFGGAPTGFSFFGLSSPLGGAIPLDSLNSVFGFTGGTGFYFDPTSFAISIGMMIISDLLSCDQQEQILAMRRGQNLCHEIGTYCSSKIKIGPIKICIEKTKSYCCYNSRLARIINEQGRAQIGKGWGSAESPNCSGFTQSEFAAIDFSRIDLSEFMSEVMANVSMPNIQGMTQNTQGVVQQKMQNYYQRGRQ